MNFLLRKLKSRNGESIAEVLVALLVACLGILMFASMISSSYHVIVDSRQAAEKYYKANNYVASEGTTVTTGIESETANGDASIKVTVPGLAEKSYSGSYYENKVFQNYKVFLYKKG